MNKKLLANLSPSINDGEFINYSLQWKLKKIDKSKTILSKMYFFVIKLTKYIKYISVLDIIDIDVVEVTVVISVLLNK